MKPPPPPTQLGRFEVGPRVGGGGMANVYVGRGTTPDGEEELVALKVIRDELGRDARHLRMFSDEAKILSRMHHPNVIQTLEYGITSTHRYIAMELLGGRTLADVWELVGSRDGVVPPRLGAFVCARVAAGLHAAHELADERGEPLNVIHRDINPWNVFLTHDGRVKLIDFGLAKARLRRERTGLAGLVKGKMAYLAPEQLMSQLDAAPLDRRVDVFALGATLWELCTMRRLFKRDTDLATVQAIQACEVPDPRSVRADCPGPLAEVALRALARDPAERYATAAEIARDLDAFVAAREEEEMTRELASLMLRLFPQDLKRHDSWRRGAVSPASPLATVPPPPLPVPVASSNMVDDAPEIVLGDADIELVPKKR